MATTITIILLHFRIVFEKSLKQERFEHQQTKRELRQRSKEMKDLNDNTLAETNGKFSALQQSYKLLKIQNEDLTESCEKKRDDLLQRIEKLEATKGEEVQKLRRDNEKFKVSPLFLMFSLSVIHLYLVSCNRQRKKKCP